MEQSRRVNTAGGQLIRKSCTDTQSQQQLCPSMFRQPLMLRVRADGLTVPEIKAPAVKCRKVSGWIQV